MTDTWSAEGDDTDRSRRDPLRAAAMRELVERALQRELACRRELRPHAQLAVSRHAAREAVDAAYTRLQGRYDPGAFAEYGEDAVAAARSIVDLLGSAYRSLCEPVPINDEESSPQRLCPLHAQPRRDETLRALETLRLAISRRLAEAEQHRAAGRLTDAIRVFESVVILDRKNVVARTALRELRAELETTKTTVVDRILARVLRRDSK